MESVSIFFICKNIIERNLSASEVIPKRRRGPLRDAPLPRFRSIEENADKKSRLIKIAVARFHDSKKKKKNNSDGAGGSSLGLELGRSR